VTTILLARHGETDWNREGRFQGHADPPLNRTGRAQAVDLSVALMAEELAAVYSSPLQRALETAEVIAASHGLEPVPVDGLREVDVGSWSGLTRAEIDERFPGHERHDGETREAHSARVVAALEQIAHTHPGERILVVSHGGSLGALRRHAGVEFEGRLENCAVFELHFRDGSFVGVD
jgi:uncharacterized phosphatase